MRYSASPEILRESDLAEVAWRAIEPIWDDLPLSSFNALAAFMEELSSGQRSLIAIDWCQKEIRNGGIKQLFFNSTGNLVPWAIAGFTAIGANKYADILSKATSLLGEDYPKSGSARRKIYGQLSEVQKLEIEDLSDHFLALVHDPAEDIETYRGSYVKRNAEQFIRSKSAG